MSTIRLRPCTANDVDIAVPLIHDSGPIAFRYVFAQDHEAQSLEFLHAAFVEGSGQFGYHNHLAVERDGALVAVAASWDARANLRFTLNAARQILGFYGLRSMTVIGRGIRMERVVRPAVPGVAYLGHLTVAPECRGQGVGREMISQLLERARAAAHARAALDVAVSNPRARALYQGLGFRMLDTRKSRLVGRWGNVVDHQYMECDLAQRGPWIPASVSRS